MHKRRCDHVSTCRLYVAYSADHLFLLAIINSSLRITIIRFLQENQEDTLALISLEGIVSYSDINLMSERTW